VNSNFLVDAQCGQVTVQQNNGMFRFASQIPFPYIPIISKFADHPVSKGLEAVVMQFASSIDYIGSDTNDTFTPLAFTSDKSGSLPTPQFFNVQKQWGENDLPLSSLTVAGVLEHKNNIGTISRICIIGDGDFPVEGSGQQRQQIQPDNVNLIVNSIDWLGDDSGLSELRTKGVNYRPIDELEDSTKTILKYLNFLLPILLVIIYGVIRTQVNRNERMKRMQENYE
jgi:ABC-type uncharacterized transport system involved in gliding motility auxiliary subunit